VTPGARQTPSGARPNRRAFSLSREIRVARPMPSGRSLEASGNRRPRGMAIAWGGVTLLRRQNPAYSLL